MRIRTLNSDGSHRDALQKLDIVNEAGEPYVDPPVVITVRLLSRHKQREIQRAAVQTRRNPRTNRTYRETDEFLAGLAILKASIVSWDGVLSDEGDLLPITEATIAELPAHVVEQVNAVIQSTEADDDASASFRESDDVVRVVGGSG